MSLLLLQLDESFQPFCWCLEQPFRIDLGVDGTSMSCCMLHYACNRTDVHNVAQVIDNRYRAIRMHTRAMLEQNYLESANPCFALRNKITLL